MANMSYCRFQNTYQDLRDCYSNMSEEVNSRSEFMARKRLIELCMQIADSCSDILEEEFEEDEDEDY